MNSEITPMTSVNDAIIYVKTHLHKGVECPVCGQNAKIYRRILSPSMALVLDGIYRCPDKFMEKGYLHVENYLKKLNCPASMRGDFPKLRFWDLIVIKPEGREDGSNRNGYYQITTKGENFVEGLISVPDYVLTFNNKLEGVSQNMITFQDALKGEKFDFQQIMTLP